MSPQAKDARRLIVGLVLLTLSLCSAFAQSPQLFSIVVWLNTATGIYHLKGMRWYGNTTSGAFACQKEADRAGFRLSVFVGIARDTGTMLILRLSRSNRNPARAIEPLCMLWCILGFKQNEWTHAFKLLHKG